ncbi:maleylpyruvate isomerase family mycothiol-dependent enzyme [Streptomyces sp. I05A-00742]|uniref:maleylpyruvate isomerase family mycothiol-dependent enzyme n=1 Tax=Streptomyces sp. I05A-00742 TaxID=2732853 RepID=UPI002899FB0E|nr:maleylpyruvate isomerase family mycothiol-dependent enzyme [Streptomyces sp. I05A-00742]
MEEGPVRARGDFDRMVADLARERAAAFIPAELTAHLREAAETTRHAPLSGPLDPITDLLVHEQDIARPLGRVWRMPVAPALAAIGHVLESRFYGARKRFADVRLVATDVNWSAGEGPDDLRGPLEDLLLLATGGTAALSHVTDPGRERLAAATS